MSIEMQHCDMKYVLHCSDPPCAPQLQELSEAFCVGVE